MEKGSFFQSLAVFVSFIHSLQFSCLDSLNFTCEEGREAIFLDPLSHIFVLGKEEMRQRRNERVREILTKRGAIFMEKLLSFLGKNVRVRVSLHHKLSLSSCVLSSCHCKRW
jgi:hypothetical protein